VLTLVKGVNVIRRFATCLSRSLTQGHRNWHGSIGHLWLPVNVPQHRWAYLVPFLGYIKQIAENCEFPHPALFN